MDNIKKSVKFPALIYRNEKAIDDEIARLRLSREGIAENIKSLTKSLSEWMGEAVSYEWALGFANAGEYEIDLIEHYKKKNSIPETVRFEKVKEVYNVPDYTNILALASTLHEIESQYIVSFLVKGEVVIPEVTKGEKEGVIEKNSVYIGEEKTWAKYCAIKSLCDYANTMNFAVFAENKKNKIQRATLLPSLPDDFSKFIDWEPANDDSQKRRFMPKYLSFKQM